MTAQGDAWLAEMWPVCREVSREDREVTRALAEANAQPVDGKPVDKRRKCAQREAS